MSFLLRNLILVQPVVIARRIRRVSACPGQLISLETDQGSVLQGVAHSESFVFGFGRALPDSAYLAERIVADCQ
jgi:hypothetical protein